LPPHDTISRPPPAGFDATCQKSYSVRPSGAMTVMWPSPPPAARAASGMRIRSPSISQRPQGWVQWTRKTGSLGLA
jgi:hypothetical protein